MKNGCAGGEGALRRGCRGPDGGCGKSRKTASQRKAWCWGGGDKGRCRGGSRLPPWNQAARGNWVQVQQQIPICVLRWWRRSVEEDFNEESWLTQTVTSSHLSAPGVQMKLNREEPSPSPELHLDGKQLMTKHCKFPADQNWQCQKPSHRFLRFPITHWSTHKPHNSNAHILQITCFFLGLWNENKVSQTKILQDYIKYRQKYRPVPPLGLLVDPPMVSISKFHVTSFSGYHIYKIFRKPDLWRWPWGWVH